MCYANPRNDGNLADNQNEFHIGKLVDSFTLYTVCVLVGSLLYLPYWKREVKERQVTKQALKKVDCDSNQRWNGAIITYDTCRKSWDGKSDDFPECMAGKNLHF